MYYSEIQIPMKIKNKTYATKQIATGTNARYITWKYVHDKYRKQ